KKPLPPNPITLSKDHAMSLANTWLANKSIKLDSVTGEVRSKLTCQFVNQRNP
ncbi:MAG: hypothetical protein ACI9TP_001944, partial [Candidatus Azotimanducaceae bacterium]